MGKIAHAALPSWSLSSALYPTHSPTPFMRSRVRSAMDIRELLDEKLGLTAVCDAHDSENTAHVDGPHVVAMVRPAILAAMHDPIGRLAYNVRSALALRVAVTVIITPCRVWSWNADVAWQPELWHRDWGPVPDLRMRNVRLAEPIDVMTSERLTDIWGDLEAGLIKVEAGASGTVDTEQRRQWFTGWMTACRVELERRGVHV